MNFKLRNPAGWAAALGLILILTTGCRHLTVEGDPYNDETAVRVKAPESIAILPTSFQEGDADLANRMRHALYSALSTLPFEDREIALTDGRLADIATELGVLPENIPSLAMTDPRLADCVVYSNIKRIGSIWLLFYAERSIDLDFAMVDTRTRRVLYRNHFVIHDRRGAPFYSLFGMIESLGETLWHLKSSQTEESMEEGARKIAETIPLPILPAAKSAQLEIHEVRLMGNLPNLGLGQVLRVWADASVGMQCTFSIGGATEDLPMVEISPGIYEGTYIAKKGDDKPYAVVELTLQAPGSGERLNYVEALQPFVIDCDPPPTVLIKKWWPKGSKGVFLEFGVNEKLKPGQTTEVETYLIYRKQEGEEDFSQVGLATESPWLDGSARPGNKYEYYIRARDTAGNLSAPDEKRGVNYE